MKMVKQKGICEECGIEYEYEYNPKYPRKYCLECSAAKKQAYEDNKPVPVERPGENKGGADATWGKAVPKTNSLKPYEKDPVGLSMDGFCVMFERIAPAQAPSPKEIMDIAINLVKQAREAFASEV